MPEDARKKFNMRDFLQQVKQGLGFIQDIWIEREVKFPGTGEQYTEAKSHSTRSITNVTEMLNDDLKYCFNEGFFTFRFIAAVAGSGKTALLEYLVTLIEVEPSYSNHSVVARLTFSDLLSQSGSQSFGVKFYSYILTETFWLLIKDSSNVPPMIKDEAENFLKRFLGNERFSSLKSDSEFKMGFTNRLNGYLAEKQVNFEDFFFQIINKISERDSSFTFVYLIDELDALHQDGGNLENARSLVRALINKASRSNRGRIRLMFYMVGISDDVKNFITENDALRTRVFDSIIMLVPYRKDEADAIKKRITSRIKDAYSGCQDFSEAWNKIENIRLDPGVDFSNLREFCKEYASRLLEIHENYFKTFDRDFNIYEEQSRQKIEVQCRIEWRDYLRRSEYQIAVETTTATMEGHAFDCYIKLLRRGGLIARAFGEAKNCELLRGHLDTFDKWLHDVEFQPSSSDGHPPDLAFMVAPSCSPLLKRMLELKSIHFIQSDKIVFSPDTEIPRDISTININTADQDNLMKVFQGTGLRNQSAIVNKLIETRRNKTYSNLDELAIDLGIRPAANAKEKLRMKIERGEFCF